ncbi:MAG: RNA polymerase sigma factor [Lachnospiraceae bacterium]|nr:RNA polymerase sigma factor [Lachnospiraceae bacterium]
MEDSAIIDLYWKRSQQAIEETEKKYGGYCHSVAMRILLNREDAAETVNDTMLAAWNSIPPNRPNVLRTYLGRIVRNLSLNKLRHIHAQKRGEGDTWAALDELSDCVSDGTDFLEGIEANELAGIIQGFLTAQKEVDKRIFIRRYYYFDSIQEISTRFACGESKVKSILFRMRKKLEKRLTEEGYYYDERSSENKK